MASNQTEHYSLNQWQLSDSVVMADFNADNQKVDAALAGLNRRIDAAVANAAQDLNSAVTSTEQSLNSAVAGIEKKLNSAVTNAEQNLNSAVTQICATIPNVVYGSYTGEGTASKNQPRTLTFSFKPLLVIITTEEEEKSAPGLTGTYPWIMARPWKHTHNYHSGSNMKETIKTHVIWKEKGVQWYAQYGDGQPVSAADQLDAKDVTYYYIAIG